MSGDEELEKARQRVDQQTKEANKRTTIAGAVKRWWYDQLQQNGFREMVDIIVRGK